MQITLLALYDYLSVRRMSLSLLVLNVFAAILYVYVAMPSWMNPIELAQGVNTTTGEPFVWAARALPIVTALFLINLTWGMYICVKRKWQTGLLWITSIAIWVIAIWIDFSHH